VLLLKRNLEPARWTLLHGDTRWEGAPPCSFVANAPGLLLEMAVGACGIVAVPDTMAQARVRSGELRRVLSDWCLPPEPAWAVFLGRRLMPSKTRAFIEMLEAALKTD